MSATFFFVGPDGLCAWCVIQYHIVNKRYSEKCKGAANNESHHSSFNVTQVAWYFEELLTVPIYMRRR